MWTFVPDPSEWMKALEDPSTFWFILQGKIIIAPLRGPARAQEGPDRTRNFPQKPVKQQLFPVHHIKVQGTIIRETYRKIKGVCLNDPRGLWNQPPQACFSRWPVLCTLSLSTFSLSPSHGSKNRAALVEVIQSFYTARPSTYVT